MIKLQINQSFTKRSRTKIKNQKNKDRSKNPYKSKDNHEFCITSVNFKGRRKRRGEKKTKVLSTINCATTDCMRYLKRNSI